MTGEALRQARLREGLSQGQLAQLAGVSEITIVRAEKPDYPLSDLAAARIARAFRLLRAESRPTGAIAPAEGLR